MNFLKFFYFIAILSPYALYAQDHKKMMDQMIMSDSRKPVKLNAMMAKHQLANMREHLNAVQEIIAAMSDRNFQGMKTASQKLATTPQMAMMCEHMGQMTPGFTQMGMALHTEADKLVVLADKKDYNGFVKQLSVTTKTCTSCHAQFKQEIIP